MNKQQIIDRLSQHTNSSIKEMYNIINWDRNLRLANEEYLQILENEMRKRQILVDEILETNK